MIPAPSYIDGEWLPKEWEMVHADGRVTREWAHPGGMETPLAEIVASLSASVKAGAFPFPGGILSQPARMMAAVRLWDRAVAACERQMIARTTVATA